MDTTAVPTAADPLHPDPELAEDFFEALGGEDMPDQEKATILLQMVELVQTRVFDHIFDTFNQQQRDRFVELMESENIEETEAFLQGEVPDYDELFLTEAKKLRRELVTKLAA